MTAPLAIRHEPNPSPASQEHVAAVLSKPGFGQFFTDHMFTAHWTPDDDWHDARVTAYGPISLDPATAVLHYGQEIFEGLKAYRHADGSVWTFRPEVNAVRFQGSARRLALPQLPAADFVAAIDALVRADLAWVPAEGEKSLYVRPFMFASEAFLGVRPARHVTFAVIASPAGAYFPGDVRPVSLWLSEEFTRAARGGTGEAKCGGNYAASLLPQREALSNGCDQVVFLDAVEGRWVEELGGMNIYFVYADGSFVTPELTGSILEGVTRNAVLTLAASAGHKVEERKVDIDEWRDGVAGGEISEVFACGTAAVVTPVGSLKWRGGELSMGAETGAVTMQIRESLLDIQYGRTEDAHGWLHRVA